MATIPRLSAVVMHPSGDYMGNVLWPGRLSKEHLEGLPEAIASITAKGYYAVPFWEGDGIAFRPNEGIHDPKVILSDLRVALGFLDLETLDPDEGQARALARLAGDRTIGCTCLVPVEGLRLEERFDLGATRFHPPVDGEENRLADHAWRELCDVPGADVDPGWAPDEHGNGTTELLAHPLIERRMEVPLACFYAAGASFDGQSPLLRLAMEDADHALDPIRFDLCHYLGLEYLPAKAGWIGDAGLAYVVPDDNAPKPRLLRGKPYVLRVSNTWLGLELQADALAWSRPLADLVVDDASGNEITLALKAALRALNRAFYLVELEASFLHLVYAIDALCEPNDLRGGRHRLWICAYGSGGEAAQFGRLLAEFENHYATRNHIVHEGATFAGLGLVGEEQCEFMLTLLQGCILTFLRSGFANRGAAAAFAFDALTSPEYTSRLPAMKGRNYKLPLTADSVFTAHMKL